MRLKYTLEVVASKHREKYKKALFEIGKASELMKTPGKTTTPSVVNIIKSPISQLHQSEVPQSSTPISQQRDRLTPNMSEGLPTLCLTKDVAVNTPEYLDLSFQVGALTDRCIELEKALIEEKNLNSAMKPHPSNDFFTKILQQELNKNKMENENLKSVIDILQNDNKKLLEEVNQQRNSSKCLQCYPPLNNSWHTVKRRSSSLHNLNVGKIECENVYAVLLNENFNYNKESISEEEIKTRKSSEQNNKKTITKNVKTNVSCKMEINKSKHKILILADSHGKSLGNMIEQRSSANVCSFIRSGAKFGQVTEDVKELTKELSNDDHLLVIAGTNNIESTSIEQLLKDIQTLIKNSKHTNLVLATVPMRFDTPNLDLKISTVNVEIENIAKNHPELKLLPLHIFPRHVFTSHGLHMNKKGKVKTAEMVLKLLQNNSSPVKETNMATNDRITVLEAEMSQIIEQYKDDPSLDLDFKSKGLKTLICSAMGCVRDRIRPQHFAQNILQFQRSTGATIYVISYDQTAQRELWNGLTHSEFVETLRKLFSTPRPVEEAQQMDQSKATDVTYTPSATSTVHRPSAIFTASESSHQSAGVVLGETSNTNLCCMNDELRVHTVGVENDPEHCVSFVNNSNVNSTVSLASSIGFLGM
ncbi:hypothetical protein J6590_060591 [Homalodisca vitripennis]|nr:hypothetical protein J6590_060591 [Homalodisca vitripennis]